MAYKTFVVERTEDESTQTAGPATLNRADVPPLVKVFDDESDIVLSTLSTNEIVATKNTDYSSVAIVDRVAKDNLNPVTSNAVATALSYSTDETLTGGYWIDGKPIYKITAPIETTGAMTAGTWNRALSNVDFDSIINVWLVDVSSTGARFIFSGIFGAVGRTVDNFDIMPTGQGISAVASGATRYVTVEYTKTGD